jgi:hypothetical protein
MQIPKDLKKQLDAQGVRVVEKAGWFWNTLHWCVIIFTFGANRRFRDGFVTTLGATIAVPPGRKWTEDLRTTIEHEMVHVGQFRKMGLGSAYLGILPGFFWYILFPLPIGFCWGRWQMERWAYLVNIRACKTKTHREYAIAHVVRNMTTSAYGWPLPPFKWAKRYIENWLRLHI